MIVIPTDDFNKSVKKITDKIAIKRLNSLVLKLEEANNLKGINNVEPISNHPFIYRIRTGNYRLIVKYLDGDLTILLFEYAKRNEKTYLKYK